MSIRSVLKSAEYLEWSGYRYDDGATSLLRNEAGEYRGELPVSRRVIRAIGECAVVGLGVVVASQIMKTGAGSLETEIAAGVVGVTAASAVSAVVHKPLEYIGLVNPRPARKKRR